MKGQSGAEIVAIFFNVAVIVHPPAAFPQVSSQCFVSCTQKSYFGDLQVIKLSVEP